MQSRVVNFLEAGVRAYLIVAIVGEKRGIEFITGLHLFFVCLPRVLDDVVRVDHARVFCIFL